MRAVCCSSTGRRLAFLKGYPMAKGQKRTSKEARKPKAEHNQKKKTNISNPSLKTGVVNGLEHMKKKS